YMRPFMLALENEYQNEICASVIPEIILRFAKEIQVNLIDRPHFGFFWTSHITHGTIANAVLADPLYSSLLNEILDEKLNDNTAIILLSDHGMRCLLIISELSLKFCVL